MENVEPGEWRIEIKPSAAARDDLFLVVMQPTLQKQQHRLTVRPLQDGHRLGCEILGVHRQTRWWFMPGINGVEVEIVEGGTSKRHAITGGGT